MVTGANFTQASRGIVMVLKGASTCEQDVWVRTPAAHSPWRGGGLGRRPRGASLQSSVPTRRSGLVTLRVWPNVISKSKIIGTQHLRLTLRESVPCCHPQNLHTQVQGVDYLGPWFVFINKIKYFEQQMSFCWWRTSKNQLSASDFDGKIWQLF